MKTAVSVPPVTRTLAEFAARTTYGDLPAEVGAMAKRCILDSLGCGLYASTLPSCISTSCLTNDSPTPRPP